MQLTPQAVQEFKEIYQEEYGQEVSDAEARDMGTRLLRVLKVLQEISANDAPDGG